MNKPVIWSSSVTSLVSAAVTVPRSVLHHRVVTEYNWKAELDVSSRDAPAINRRDSKDHLLFRRNWILSHHACKALSQKEYVTVCPRQYAMSHRGSMIIAPSLSRDQYWLSEGYRLDMQYASDNMAPTVANPNRVLSFIDALGGKDIPVRTLDC